MRAGLCALTAVAALGLGGCSAAADNGGRTLSASEARAATSAGFGIPVFPQGGRTEATVANLNTVYYGGTDFENVVVSVFDDRQGKDDVLGSPAGEPPPGTEIISVANVVVLYSRSENAPDRSEGIRRALRAAAARA